MADIINSIKKTFGMGVSSNNIGKNWSISHEVRALSNQEIYELLINIDEGHFITEDEKLILSSIEAIRWEEIDKLPKSMRLLSSLLELYLNDSYVNDISVLSNLTTLTILDLSDTYVSDISTLSNLTTLSTLDLRGTSVSDISALSNLTTLSTLDLRGTYVRDISALSNLTTLTTLDLSFTLVSDISALSNLKNLNTLNLSEMEIEDLDAVSGLTALRKLNIQNSKTSKIPESVLDLNLRFIYAEDTQLWSFGDGIYIHGLTLTDQPIEIFSQSRELIRAYYGEGDQVPVNECKVIFLGDAASGKTYSIKRLLNNGEFLKDYYGELTPGIEITTSRIKLADTDIVVNYWDFGGQEILHSMHRVFLTERAVYVVFLNARDDGWMDDSARYWMENIKAFAPDAPVLVVINQIDLNEHPRFNEKDFIDSYGDQVKKIIRLSAKTDEKQVFLDKLQGNINSIIMELPTVSKKIPRSWKNLMGNIREMPDHYLTTDQFIKKWHANSIKNYEEIHDELVDLFQVIGVTFCYYKNRSVADYVLLNPKWMLNALYTIVTNGKAVAQNGVITQDNLNNLLEKDDINGITIRKVVPELRYKGFEVNYILGVIRMFGLSYSLQDGSEFFPMLCDRDEKISVKDAVPRDALHFIYRYTYLPTNVMHRLMVEMQRELDYQYVWYTGAVFRNTQYNQTAYIHSLENDLHIYVYGEDKYYKLNEYLTPISNEVRNTNSYMGLSAEELLTYRSDKGEVEIPLKRVKGNLDHGIDKEYNETIGEIIYYDTLISQYFNNDYSEEEKFNSFFQKYDNQYPHFSDLLQFIEEENSDDLKKYLQIELGDLFRFVDVQNSMHRTNEVQELLELLWKLYLIDSDRIKNVEVSTTPFINGAKYDTDENNPDKEKTQVISPEIKDEAVQYKPEWTDFEKATYLVLKDFEEWWEKDADRRNLTFSIEKHVARQRSGNQFGYDVGLNSKIGDVEFRLRFECKNYTSKISDKKQDMPLELSLRSYAYNLLEYYMGCEPEVNNRWVLVCPFGGLQNDFLENLFKPWNKEHTFMKIYAIMENGPFLTCKDFLSVNDEAYRLVYNKAYDGNLTKDAVFTTLKNTIIGNNDVQNAALERLRKYDFWEEYRGHKGLLPVPDRKNQIALGQILDFLQRNKENTNDAPNKTLFVIGEYGTGKSWLCYQAIEQIVFHPKAFPLMPFFLRLKELSRNQELEDKTKYKYIMKDILSTYFEKYDKWAGECVQKDYQPVFFIDGFDEVFSGLSATDKKIYFLLSIINELKNWYERHENERGIIIHTKPFFVITSRESDFEVGKKSDEFQDQMEQAETIELEMCSVEEVQEEWNKLEKEDNTDRSWIFKLDQNSAFLNIIRRPVFYRLCSNALEDNAFKKKVDLASADEVDVLDLLFEYELQNYACGEGTDKNEIRSEIYRCAVECSKQKKSRVVYKGKGINQIIHVGMVKIKKDQDTEETCWVSFEHNIVREYLTAKCLSEQLINCSASERNDPMCSSFINTLRKLSLTPEALKILLLCIEKKSPKDKGAKYKQQLKEWLCHDSIKKSNSCLPARLLEILLQPGHTLSGDKNEILDLSGLYAIDLCLWNCGIRHVNLSQAEIRNWQMINLELDDVDLRGANMEGLRIAPDKPISSFCYWKDTKEWHIAALHENGQLMQYSFPKNSWNHFSAEILSKTGVKDGLFRFRNELMLYSAKKLYDENENELYQIQSGNELERVVTASGLNGFITKQEDNCKVIVFRGDATPTAFLFSKTKPRYLDLTENGYVFSAQNGALSYVYENGGRSEVKRICEWKSDYECFAVRLDSVEKAFIYIKCSDRLIRIVLDEELNERISLRTELQIQGDLETIRELRVINETTLAAIGKNELYILSIEKNKDVEEVKCKKLKTDIIIRNSLLEDEDGSNRVRDAKAYELLCASMC